jgi:hypothetical protein
MLLATYAIAIFFFGGVMSEFNVDLRSNKKMKFFRRLKKTFYQEFDLFLGILQLAGQVSELTFTQHGVLAAEAAALTQQTVRWPE